METSSGDPSRVGASAGQLRSFFDVIDEGFCICELVVDSDGAAVDYRFLDANALFAEMTGLSDPVGRTALELVPDLEPRWIETYARVALEGEQLRFEQASEAMGRWFDVFAAPFGAPGQFALVFKDTTDRHLADQTLRETGERFRSFLDDLPVMVWVHDHTGAQEFVNVTYCDYFGVSRSEMQGDRWQELIDPASGAEYEEEFVRAVSEQRTFRADVRVRNAAGAWRTLQSIGTPRFDRDGTFVGHIGVSNDVTESRTALQTERDARLGAEILQRTAAALAAATSIDEAAEALVEGLGPIELGSVSVSVERAGRLRTVAASGIEPGLLERFETFPVDGDSPISNAFRDRVTIEFADAADHDARHPDLAALREEAGFESILVLPIIGSRDNCLAVLAMANRVPRWFTPQRMGLLKLLSLQAGGAFERAAHHERDRRARERADFISSVLVELEECRTVSAQLARLTELLVPEMFDFVSIEAPSGPQQVLALKHDDPIKHLTLAELRRRFAPGAEADHSLAAVAAGQPQLVRTMTEAIRTEFLGDDAAALFERLGVRSHLAVPILTGDPEFRSALLAGITDPDRPRLDDDDLSFMLDLTQRIGSVITSTATQERERAASLHLQRALLPQGLADSPHVDVVAHYRAGDEGLEVGGDWYDTFSWPTGHHAIVVGDVVGHGIAAAVWMGRLRIAASALIAQSAPDPAGLLDIVERCASQPGGPGFVTATCVVIDPSTETIHYATAGHPPGLLVRSGRPIWLDDATGAPICSLSTESRTTAMVDLCPDDLVVLYSDGLVERRQHPLDHGLEALVAAVSSTDRYELDHVGHAILDAMGGEGDDDIVVVTARFASTSPTHVDHLEPRTEELQPARHRLRQWLEASGDHGVSTDSVLLAASEAITNAMEHSGCQSVAVRVAINPATRQVELAVTDDGTWTAPQQFPNNRGRGVDIMRRTSTTLSHRTDPTGTSALMTFE